MKIHTFEMFCLVLICYDGNIEGVSKHLPGMGPIIPRLFLKGDCR